MESPLTAMQEGEGTDVGPLPLLLVKLPVTALDGLGSLLCLESQAVLGLDVADLTFSELRFLLVILFKYLNNTSQEMKFQNRRGRREIILKNRLLLIS